MTLQPRRQWRALVDDLHAELDQGHMTVYRIVNEHRASIDAEAVRAALQSLRAEVEGLIRQGGSEDYWEGVNEEEAAVLAAIDRALGEP